MPRRIAIAPGTPRAAFQRRAMGRLNDALNSGAGSCLKNKEHSSACLTRRAFQGIRGNLFCTGVALL